MAPLTTGDVSSSSLPGEHPSNVTCDGEGVVERILETGCPPLPRAAGQAATDQGFPAIWFEESLRPEEVEITVRRNGALVAHTEFVPQFVRLQPNGAECPPVCHAAQDTVAVDF